jgi:hypothetical protein
MYPWILRPPARFRQAPGWLRAWVGGPVTMAGAGRSTDSSERLATRDDGCHNHASEHHCERASERDGVGGAYAVEHATQEARQGQRGDGDRAQTQTAPQKVPDDFDSSRLGNPNASS